MPPASASVPPPEPVPDGRPAASGTGRPPALTALVAGVGLEVVALLVGAVVLLVELFSGGSASLGVSLFLVVFALGVAALLTAAVRALLHGRRWGRSPVATWQILQGVVAVSSLQAGVTPWVVVALVLAVAVLVLLMLGPVVEATTRDARPTA
ncbi:hypothetical protein [Cellulosimicrobium sp. NPDC057127]|uniref:hypothetical protein n=1 Tax=Cellulosimicrobium sp. NPDC057127 TaxID=3346026 RepID=UPI003642181A